MAQRIHDTASPLIKGVKRHPVAAALAAAGLAAALISAILPATGEMLVPLVVLVNTLTTGVMFLRGAARFNDRERQVWALFGVSWLLAFVGVLSGAIAFVITQETRAFGPYDGFIISGYVIALFAVVRFPHLDETAPHRIRVLIDGFVGSVALGTVLWVWFLSDLFVDLATAAIFDRVIGMLYPIVDMSLVAVMLILILRRSALQFDIRLIPLGLGFAIQSYGDLTFLLKGAGRQFADVEPTWWAFAMATSLYVFGAVIMHQRPSGREHADRDLSWMPLLAPYAPAVVLVVMVAAKIFTAPMDGELQIMLAAALFVAIGVVLRQVVAIRENREHVENERRALISSISHELRTPLTAMVGFLEVLAEDQFDLPDADRAEMVGVVKEQAEYMASIVSDMVLLARGRLNQMHINESTVHLIELIAKAQRTVEADLESFSVEVEADLHARLDADRVQQVIVNYLTNASRYGGPTVEVLARSNGGDLRIEVHDDGPGIPKRYELSIWGRLERGANRFNAAVPGSGIGLAIVNSIAVAHGGAAEYRRSERLGGACFSLSLPGRVSMEATAAAKTAREQLELTVNRMAG